MKLKIVALLVGFFIVVSAIVFIWTALYNVGLAEEPTEVWILCRPDDYIRVRETPGKRGIILGDAYCGTKMTTDSKTKYGYLHVSGLTLELQTGWVSSRYIVYDEPIEVMAEMKIVSNGRVACRSWINGKIKHWVRNDDIVIVYYMSCDWSITNKGYIMTDFLEEIQQ